MPYPFFSRLSTNLNSETANPMKKPESTDVMPAKVQNTSSFVDSYPFNLYPLNASRMLYETSIGIGSAVIAMPINYSLFKWDHPKQNFLPDTRILYPNNIRRLCLKVPMAEEFLYRGVVLPTIKKGMEELGMSSHHASKTAILGSSIAFAMAHPHARKSKLAIGLLCGYLAENNNSLWASSSSHIAHNSLIISAAKMRANKF